MKSHSAMAGEEEDDFTYTEDAAGVQTKVPVEKEFIFKVVVLGDYSVGKTCLIKRLLSVHSLKGSSSPLQGGDDDSDIPDSGDDDDDELLAAITPTVGTDFYSLSLPQVLPGASLRLQIWDTAGLEKYAAKYENTFRNASFVVCVFDVTSASSLHNIVDRHLSIAAEHIPELDQSNIMVVANKIDIIYDLANNTTALRDARKRAQSPETAFDDGHDEDTATNPEFFTSVSGIDRDAIVTAKKVQAGVFDLFGEVHYAEVSAKTRQNVKAMLQTLAYALLRNSPEVEASVKIPETESTYDIFAHTALPMQTPGNTPLRGTNDPTPPPAPAAVAAGGRGKPPQPPTPPPMKELHPPSLSEDDEEASSFVPPSPPQPVSTPPPTASKPSWGASGAFKFDMAPISLSNTAVFSPVEGSEHHADSQRASYMSAEPPSSTAPTVMQDRSVAPEEVEVAVKPQRAAKAPIDPNETPQARKAREAAEMSALLGRAGQRSGAAADKSAAPPASASSDALRDDADKMEDDAAAGRNGAGGSAAEPRLPRPSILDSLGVQNEKNKSGDGRGDDGEEGDHRRSDSDEDGVRMQARLQDRFAQLEHDIRQDNAVARETGEEAEERKLKVSVCDDVGGVFVCVCASV